MPKAREEAQPTNPELTPSQAALKGLADEMLALRPENYRANMVRFSIDLPAQEVEQKLRNSSVSDLLLKDGQSLSADPPNEYWTNLDLYVGKAEATEAEVRAWGWNYDLNEDPIKPGDEPKDIGNWGRNLEIKIWYSNGQQNAGQFIGVSTWLNYAGHTPRLHRDVTAEAYAEMGYDGHNQKMRDAKNEEEVIEFIALAKELFEARKK